MIRSLRFAVLPLVALTVFASAAVWVRVVYLPSRALRQGMEELRAGTTAIAEETIDCHRNRLVKSPDGCALLLQVYFANRNASRLHWTAESCIANGIRTPQAFMALASYMSNTGRDQEAVTILTQAATEHPNEPGIFIELGRIYQRNGGQKEAERAYNAAAKRAKDKPRALIEVITYFLDKKDLPRARELALQLAELGDQNPELQRVAANLLEKAGDAKKAKQIRDQLSSSVR